MSNPRGADDAARSPVDPCRPRPDDGLPRRILLIGHSHTLANGGLDVHFAAMANAFDAHWNDPATTARAAYTVDASVAPEERAILHGVAWREAQAP